MNRDCQTCHRPTWRSNFLRLWMTVNGVKTRVKIRQCETCAPPAVTARLVMVSHVIVGPRGGVSGAPELRKQRRRRQA